MVSDDTKKAIARLRKAILGCIELPEEERVACYNAATSALLEMVGVGDYPMLSVKRWLADSWQAKEYNRNKTASPEMDLLEQSIRCDGVTMPVVVVRGNNKEDGYTVVDGFHRRKVCKERLKRKYIPVSVIDKPLQDRMASTVRHNRARGKHQVDLMASLIKSMTALGVEDAKIAENLGMSVEELLRMKQIVGAARLLAGTEYNTAYGRDDEPENLLDT